MTDDPLQVIDLFCGAGGFSTGAALALEDLGHEIFEIFLVWTGEGAEGSVEGLP